MRHGTEEIVIDAEGEETKRWWHWRAGRRRYTNSEPTGDREANGRRSRARSFRQAYRKAHSIAARKELLTRIDALVAARKEEQAHPTAKAVGGRKVSINPNLTKLLARAARGGR